MLRGLWDSLFGLTSMTGAVGLDRCDFCAVLSRWAIRLSGACVELIARNYT